MKASGAPKFSSKREHKVTQKTHDREHSRPGREDAEMPTVFSCFLCSRQRQREPLPWWGGNFCKTVRMSPKEKFGHTDPRMNGKSESLLLKEKDKECP